MSMENQNVSKNEIFNWIQENFKLEYCNSEEFIYNDMESQSDFGLPIIYQPFDYTQKFHWVDRGQLYDFLYSINGQNKKVLDFGPGDGWPSLIVAPYVKQVVGLDSSVKRVEVCTKNAERMEIKNATFTSYTADTKMPFDDNIFDGIMAASSIEQTPNPKKTIEELYRVLKPGGRLRICYEALNCYKNGQEQDLWISELNDGGCKLILIDRNIEEEYAIQYGLTLVMPMQEVLEKLRINNEINFNQVTISFMKRIKSKIIKAQACKTVHPSGRTLVSWLREVGFKKILPSYDGGRVVAKLFDQYLDEERPKELNCIDDIIKRIVKIAVELEAPIDIDPHITVVK